MLRLLGGLTIPIKPFEKGRISWRAHRLAGGQQLMQLASMPNSLPYLPTARGPSFILDPRILLTTLGAAN